MVESVDGPSRRGSSHREPVRMVFEVNIIDGPLGDALAQAQARAIREACEWVAQHRAEITAPGSESTSSPG